MRLVLAFLCASILQAVPVNIVDILYRPSGNPPQVAASTDITITQSAFVNPAGHYYPAFQLTPHPVSGSDGSINIWLEPNVSGQPYSILYRATNGVITREYWTVPVSASVLTIADVRTTVGPTPPTGVVQVTTQLRQSGPAEGTLYANGSNGVSIGAPGTTGQVWTSNGSSSPPTFQASSGGGITAGQIQTGSLVCADDTGTASGYIVTQSPAPTIAPYSQVCFAAANTNQSSVTLSVNGNSKTIKRYAITGGFVPLADGEISAGQIVVVQYSSTSGFWQLMSVGSHNLTAASLGNPGDVFTSNGLGTDPTFQAPASGSASVQRGVFASAPSCTTSQFIYTATDAALQGFCDGASHLDWMYKGLTIIPTSASDLPLTYFTTGTTATDVPGGWIFSAPSAAGMQGRYKTTPSPPYSVVVCFEPSTAAGGSLGSSFLGTFWTDATKAITVNIEAAGTVGLFGPVAIDAWTDHVPTFSAQYLAENSSTMAPGLICIAMVDDGTNRTEKLSYDGKNWILLHSATRTTFLTATGVGIFLVAANADVKTQIRMVSLQTLNSAL